MNFGFTFMSKFWFRKRFGFGEWGRFVGSGRVVVSIRLVSFFGSGFLFGADSVFVSWLLVRS